MHIHVKGKRSKIRFIPVNPAAQRMIEDYLALTGHRSDVEGALFRPVKNNRTGHLDMRNHGGYESTASDYVPARLPRFSNHWYRCGAA